MKFVDLKLPPKTEYVHRVTFNEKERETYQALWYVKCYTSSAYPEVYVD